ncbi:MarR family winged helix-turn-helix transcriptional regulator [Cryptosporangium arvum]|uniref:MarR family winged helix-turn-helix transcriptional regulator n=1 Tax=Cryptosporangium arvum TaxID=80871 RepID=UPI0005680E14|nr:MarR family transcriptional regulator [Cryptosporangium arvum]
MPPSVNALDLVLELTVLLGEDMTQSLARDHLTEPRAHLLWVLGAQGPSTQKSLADALNVSARNITGLVDGLEQTGYVTREPHPDDRRATLVSMTEPGAAIVSAFRSGQTELAEQLFGPMTPGELDQFVTSLTGVVERLRAAIAEGRPA